MQGSLAVSRAIGDKHLGYAAHSDIHNGCSTKPRHTSCMTNIVSTEAGELHCHSPEQVQLNKRNSRCHNVKCSPATQFRCSRQKKMATKPNCGQQQQVEANGKHIYTLQKDSAERLDDNNAQATPQVIVVPCVDYCDKPHAKRTHRQTSDEIKKKSRPDLSVIDTDELHTLQLSRKPVHGGRICVSIDERHDRNRSSSASVPYGVSNL
ncbi:hypothetical protein Tco_0702477 [Tanacetum coccineum]|uniref:Uncharacterized protein n=1 Tax=Tanacetum coccineum TaxID=301880 RepID=A0ABQ4XWY7_9ASTR